MPFIREALASVFAQTLSELEVLVVDDGSDDGTSEFLQTLRDDRLRVHRQSPRGLSAARNAGVAEAAGGLVAFLDADDVWLPEKLERQLETIARSEADAVYCLMEEIDEQSRVVRTWPDLAVRYDGTRADAVTLLARGNVVVGSGSSVLARRDAIVEAGGFDETFVAAEDLDLWYRLARRRELVRIPEVLVRIRRRSDGMQSDYGRVLRGLTDFYTKAAREGDESLAPLARTRGREIRLCLIKHEIRRQRIREATRQMAALLGGSG
jgi:glycosyltransferase involved in cell wall biosynthesis